MQVPKRDESKRVLPLSEGRENQADVNQEQVRPVLLLHIAGQGTQDSWKNSASMASVPVYCTDASIGNSIKTYKCRRSACPALQS